MLKGTLARVLRKLTAPGVEVMEYSLVPMGVRSAGSGLRVLDISDEAVDFVDEKFMDVPRTV